MTSQSPRIYLYKITFEEVPYYYYGVKKEKYFNQEYWGSPITNKWCWELYTPKKQILELFEYSDEGYIEAQEVEKRIIAPVLNDKWCLNENVGGIISLKIASRSGKNQHKNKIGMFSFTKEQRVELAKRNGNKIKELGLGIFSLSSEELSVSAKKAYASGLDKAPPEQRSEWGRRGGKSSFINKKGCFSLSFEEKSILAKKNNSQKWMCLETGHISNSGGLSKYQIARGIDTSKRKRIE